MRRNNGTSRRGVEMQGPGLAAVTMSGLSLGKRDASFLGKGGPGVSIRDT